MWSQGLTSTGATASLRGGHLGLQPAPKSGDDVSISEVKIHKDINLLHSRKVAQATYLARVQFEHWVHRIPSWP